MSDEMKPMLACLALVVAFTLWLITTSAGNAFLDDLAQPEVGTPL